MIRDRAAVLAAALAAALVLLCAACAPGSPRSSAGARGTAAASSTAWRYDYLGADRNGAVSDIAAASADDAWAVARTPVTGNIDGQRASLLHYDGHRWRPYPLPPVLAPMTDLGSVRLDAPVSGGDVWLFGGAVGTGGEVLVARWDGTRWQQAGVPAQFPRDVTGAAVFAPDDAWVVDGTDTAWRWNGASWRPVRLASRVWDIAGASPGDVWAVGIGPSTEGALDNGGPVALHWDGRTWRKTAVPAVMPGESTPEPSDLQGESSLSYEAGLTRLAIRSADDVQAFGSVSGEGGQDVYQEQLTLHWDGSRWTKTPSGTVRCCVTGQAGGTVLLGSTYYLDASGRAVHIGRPPYAAGRSGKVTAVDRKQKFRVEDQAQIPGTREIWAVGAMVLDAHGDANFHRPVIARRTPAD
ncbi:hypothetical protein [Streptomyces mangrovisoli]|uniref:Uncharacterized protein n=1 Tax=Streptomyces mangrovisoli TaxID=1428628 RepID=A0A1J4NWG5_9ACTN|nr:hypothetical protein [Streptomyces mangrovisoli]OIJ65502.1 hypothetical protein WN71_023440 [Streptomyces mangrovisoli]